MAEAVDSTEVQQPAAGDEDDRKLFVGGLPQDASQVLVKKKINTNANVELLCTLFLLEMLCWQFGS
jgi:hypothetical protein